MTDLTHLDLSHLRFTVELGIDWQGIRQCAVEAGPFPTLEDAISFAQSVKGRKAFDVLAQYHNTNAFDVHDDDGLDLPLVGATVEGFTNEDGTQFSYDLQWYSVTPEYVLNNSTHVIDPYGEPALMFKGRYRTWYLRSGDPEDVLGHHFTALSSPIPSQNTETGAIEGGNFRSVWDSAKAVAEAENADDGEHMED